MSMDASTSWIPGDDDFMDYAHGDMAFAEWCRRVDRYAVRFLGMEFFQFEDLHDPMSYYLEDRTPIWFVRRVLVPAVVCDFGCNFVEELVADRVLWGNRTRRSKGRAERGSQKWWEDFEETR